MRSEPRRWQKLAGSDFGASAPRGHALLFARYLRFAKFSDPFKGVDEVCIDSFTPPPRRVVRPNGLVHLHDERTFEVLEFSVDLLLKAAFLLGRGLEERGKPAKEVPRTSGKPPPKNST